VIRRPPISSHERAIPVRKQTRMMDATVCCTPWAAGWSVLHSPAISSAMKVSESNPRITMLCPSRRLRAVIAAEAGLRVD